MESLRQLIDSYLKHIDHFADNNYCVCKHCGKKCKIIKDKRGRTAYDIKSVCECGNTEYEIKPSIENDERAVKILSEFADACKNEIHENLVKSKLPDKEEQIQAYIKIIIKRVKPIVDSRIVVLETRQKKLLSEKSNKTNYTIIQNRLNELKLYIAKYKEIQDNLTALIAFRHFKTFCLYIDGVFGSKKPFSSSMHLFEGFYFYANSMVLNKDVHFIEKQCFAGAGKSITDSALMAFILGVDINSYITKIFGNSKNISRGIQTVLKIMTSKQYAKVFPYYQKYECDKDKMFSVCKAASGELQVDGSYQPTSISMYSKNEDIDGIRVQYLFLDDITQSKDSENKEMHLQDIARFTDCWFERKDNLDDTFIIASGTTYHQEDFLSWLKKNFGVEKAKPTKLKFTSISRENSFGLKWLSVFCVIYGLDEYDRSTYEEKFPASVFIHKRENSPRSFYAMVQQQPQPPEGAPFDYDNLPNVYGKEGIPHLPDRSQEVCRASLDPSRKGKDFNSMPVIVEIEDRLYLKDCIFDNSSPDTLPAEIIDMIERHHIVHLDIENNTETLFANIIEKELKARGITYCTVTSFYSYKKKDVKIRDNETGIKQIYYPSKDCYTPSSPMGKFMRYFTGYTYEGKVKHDDSVDSLANYAQTFILNNPLVPTASSLKKGQRYRRF